MATQYLDTAPVVAAPQPAPADRRYLFGPAVDFLCLGGSSLIVLPLLLLVPASDYGAPLAATMLLVAHLINHPHFAHSYQIFYRGYRSKAFTAELGRAMQLRYIVAGIVAPAALLSFFALCLALGDARLLGYGGNAMAFFVGWHYVKQGYGMLMVDAALKRQFFKAEEKKVFLVNSYAVWIFSWLNFNDLVTEQSLWGLQYYTFAVPAPVVALAGAVALATTGATLWTLLARWRSTAALPVNGVTAYLVSLYIWLLLARFGPLWLLVVPALHSLQYLVVVWRFQANYEKAQLASPDYKAGSLARQLFGSNHVAHVVLFFVSGAVVGYLGFWGVPILLTAFVPYNEAIFGSTLFLFVAWIGINVHHYFLDNVMWRRENPDTKRYLFG